MKTTALDNVETVHYLDSMTSGHLNSINVIFTKPEHIAAFFGPGLRLALDLLRDQFPPTDAERKFVDRPVATPVDFDIDPNTLVISAPLDKLKGLSYNQLLAAQQQAKQFGYFLASGHSFNSERLLNEIQEEMNRKKPQA